MVKNILYDKISLSRFKLLQVGLVIFFLLNILPFFFNLQYELITKVNYSLVLFILVIIVSLPKNVIKYYYYYLLLFLSVLLFIFGNSGSIFSLLACSITPIIIFNSFKSYDEMHKFFYPPLFIISILAIFGGLFMYFKTHDILSELYFLGEYFVIASINYVPLTLFNFAVLFYLVIESDTIKRNNSLAKILLMLLTLFCLIASFIYLTKTTLFGAAFLLILQLRKKYLFFLICIAAFYIYKYRELLNEAFILFMGADPAEVTIKDDRRFDSALLFVNDSIQLKYNFHESQSFSTLLNMLFSIFPLSLIMIFPLLKVFKHFNLKLINQFSLLGILILLTSYQMDFLSIFTLYFAMMSITHSYKYSF